MMQPVSYRLLDLTSFDGVFFVLFFVLSLVLIMSPTLTRFTELSCRRASRYRSSSCCLAAGIGVEYDTRATLTVSSDAVAMLPNIALDIASSLTFGNCTLT